MCLSLQPKSLFSAFCALYSFPSLSSPCGTMPSHQWVAFLGANAKEKRRTGGGGGGEKRTDGRNERKNHSRSPFIVWCYISVTSLWGRGVISSPNCLLLSKTFCPFCDKPALLFIVTSTLSLKAYKTLTQAAQDWVSRGPLGYASHTNTHSPPTLSQWEMQCYTSKVHSCTPAGVQK